MTVNATVHIVNAAVTPFFTSSSSELAKKTREKIPGQIPRFQTNSYKNNNQYQTSCFIAACLIDEEAENLLQYLNL